MERHLIEKKPTWWLLYTLGTALVGSIWMILPPASIMRLAWLMGVIITTPAEVESSCTRRVDAAKARKTATKM